MELRQLEYVVTLADELSFRRTAERLTIAQSGLSQQVRRLERELGVALFDRSTHHVALTPAGTAFVQEARRTLDAAERARQAATGHAPEADRLRICLGSGTMDTIPTILEAVRAQLPELEVTTIEGGLPRQRRLLESGELDLGLALLDGDPGPGLAARLVRREPMGIIVAARHPLADRDRVRWSDLDHETLFVATEEEHPEYNSFLADVLAETGASPAMIRCPDVPVALPRVYAGDGLLCVPELPVLPIDVVWRPLVDPAVGKPTSLVWRRHDKGPLLRRFLDIASATARDRQWLR